MYGYASRTRDVSLNSSALQLQAAPLTLTCCCAYTAHVPEHMPSSHAFRNLVTPSPAKMLQHSRHSIWYTVNIYMFVFVRTFVRSTLQPIECTHGFEHV